MIFIGVDLGKRRDFSAIAVVNKAEGIDPRFESTPWMQSAYKTARPLVVRHLERLALGTRYTEVTRRIVEVVQHPDLKPHRKRLVVDATGVGQPVVELLQAAKPGCEIMPVILTGGDHEATDGTTYYLPKVDLMAGLATSLECGLLQFASRAQELPALLQELREVSITATHRNHTRIGAEGAHKHDDLVIAVALACWSARKTIPSESTGRLYW